MFKKKNNITSANCFPVNALQQNNKNLVHNTEINIIMDKSNLAPENKATSAKNTGIGDL